VHKGLEVKPYLVRPRPHLLCGQRQICRGEELELKVPCSYYLTEMGKFALLRYLSEFLTKGFVVLSIANSKSKHLGAQGTFNLRECIT